MFTSEKLRIFIVSGDYGKRSVAWNGLTLTLAHLKLTCSKSTIETLQKGVKYVQS